MPWELGRWVRRGVLIMLGGAAVLLLSSCEPIEHSFVVNSLVDAVDAAVGDGECETAVAGQCTLRAAIQEANATPGHDEVTLADGATYTLSLAGANENAAATGDLDVTRPLLLHAHGSTVDAAGIDRVFHVSATGRLVLDHATVT